MNRSTALLIATSALTIIAAAPASAQDYYGQSLYYGAPSSAYDQGYDAQPRARVNGRAQRQLPPNLYRDPAYADDPYELPSAAPRAGTRLAALPPDADPAYSSRSNYDLEVDTGETTRQVVADPTGRARGTITINTGARKLYLSLGNGEALEYGIGVGREGFQWSGLVNIARKAEWPDWTPPPEMIARQPYLPRFMAGGPGNPMGARAMYLGATVYRIHGTNQPETIGQSVSSGCFRLANGDVVDLYSRVEVGAKVIIRHSASL